MESEKATGVACKYVTFFMKNDLSFMVSGINVSHLEDRRCMQIIDLNNLEKIIC